MNPSTFRGEKIVRELRKTHADFAEGGAQTAVGGEGAGDEGPEGAGVIELTEVTEFMDDNVIGEVRREKGDFVVEIEVAFAGATSPP